MSSRTKTARPYDSSKRRAQAEASRREILRSARQLFVDQGYAATTMAEVAQEAGVSLKTVYLGFATKAGLVRALWDVSLRGEADLPVAEHDWYRAVLDEPDPERKLRINAQNARLAKTRIGDVFEIIRGSAPADPDLAELWELIQREFYDNQRVIVQQLADAKALRDGLDVTTATDLLWALNHPDLWLLLVHRRGWTPEAWETWFADTACAQLLGDRRRPAQPRPRARPRPRPQRGRG